MQVQIRLANLSHSSDLWSDNTKPEIERQLKALGRSQPDESTRFRVKAAIHQGQKSPAYDIDNYATKIINALTYTKLLWVDDSQIDELCVVRTIDKTHPESVVDLVIEAIDVA